MSSGVTQADLAQLLPNLIEGLLGHPSQRQVLLMRDAGAAPRMTARERGQLMELLTLDIAQGQLDGHRSVAVLLLRLNVAGQPPVEFSILAEAGVRAVEGWSVLRLILDEKQRCRVERPLGLLLLELFFHHQPELIDADAGDEELYASLHAVLP